MYIMYVWTLVCISAYLFTQIKTIGRKPSQFFFKIFCVFGFAQGLMDNENLW